MIIGFPGFDGSFFAIGYNIAGHFKILQVKYKNLKYSKSDRGNLIKIIGYHLKVMHCCKQLRKSYAVALTGMFMVCSLSICFLGFHAVMVIKPFKFIFKLFKT
jgi:hypothetical protein